MRIRAEHWLRSARASTRLRMVALIVVTLLPVFALVAQLNTRHRDERRADARTEVLRLSQIAGDRQRQAIDSTRPTLTVFARSQEVATAALAATGSDPTCGGLVHRLADELLYANVGLIALDGSVLCSAVPVPPGTDLSDRTYFQRAIRADGFAVGDYQVGRITGRASLNLAHPVKVDGTTSGVAFVTLDLENFATNADGGVLPDDSTVGIFDETGTLLARTPDHREWVGKSIAPETMEYVRQHRTGIREERGIDGIDRIYGFSPLIETPTSSAFIGVGVPTAEVFRSSDATYRSTILALLAVTLISTAGAMALSWRLVTKPVRRLRTVATRMSAGDFTARSGMTGRTELDDLGRTLDMLAESVQQHRHELFVAAENERELQHRASHDSLTGLPNRALLVDRLEQALARSRRHGTSVGVMFVDLDNFKTVNDTVGHDAGDRVLVETANRLRASLRDSDIAVRLGGDEFVVLCEDLPPSKDDAERTAHALAERLNDRLAPPILLPGGMAIDAGGSIGLAVGGPGSTAESILNEADMAMYRAKRRLRLGIHDAASPSAEAGDATSRT